MGPKTFFLVKDGPKKPETLVAAANQPDEDSHDQDIDDELLADATLFDMMTKKPGGGPGGIPSS